MTQKYALRLSREELEAYDDLVSSLESIGFGGLAILENGRAAVEAIDAVANTNSEQISSRLVEPEPVAEVVANENLCLKLILTNKDLPIGTKLYTAPPTSEVK